MPNKILRSAQNDMKNKEKAGFFRTSSSEWRIIPSSNGRWLGWGGKLKTLKNKTNPSLRAYAKQSRRLKHNVGLVNPTCLNVILSEAKNLLLRIQNYKFVCWMIVNIFVVK